MITPALRDEEGASRPQGRLEGSTAEGRAEVEIGGGALGTSAPPPPAVATEASAPAAGSASERSGGSGDTWLAEIAREPEWTLHTPSAAPTVVDERPSPAASDPESAHGTRSAQRSTAPEDESSAPSVGVVQQDDVDEAFAWGGDPPAAGESGAGGRADESSAGAAEWPHGMEFPVDELGFPQIPPGYELLFSARQAAAQLGADVDAGAGEGGGQKGGEGGSAQPDPERIARILQTLAEQVRAGALRLPGEVAPSDEAVVLAATLTALLSRPRE